MFYEVYRSHPEEAGYPPPGVRVPAPGIFILAVIAEHWVIFVELVLTVKICIVECSKIYPRSEIRLSK